VFAPANTPAPIVKQLNEAVVEIFKQRAVIDRFAELGAELSSGSQDELRKLLASEIDVWGKVIRDAGIKLD
jgi:tripartite-type tricarboxylate transporter receptor subunit TctC